MKRALVVMLFIAACSDSTTMSSIDAPPLDDAVCKANLESELDRSCQTPADCVLVESEDCCGPIMLAVHAGTESRFASSEQRYEVCLACPPLGCAHAPQDEMGRTASGSQMIVAECTAGRCSSTVQ